MVFSPIKIALATVILAIKASNQLYNLLNFVVLIQLEFVSEI